MTAQQTLNQVQAAWGSLALKQKVTMLTTALLTVASVLGIVWWARVPDWAVLKTGLEARDAQAVVSELQTLGVPHRLSNGGTTVEVPQEDVYQARMELTAKGVGTSGRFGYAEMFDSDSVSQSSRMQTIRYKKAQEDELARTIEALQNVSWARVHLVLPGDRVFLDDEDQAKASIMVGLAGTSSLSSQEVQAIVRTVVGAVDGLGIENVSVSDASGHVLWAGDGGGGLVGGGEIELKSAMEKSVNAKISRVLDSVVGPGRYEVQSTVELDMEKVLRREKNYDPDSAVLISEEKRKEKSDSGAGGAIGIPGVSANLPGASGGGALASSGGQTRSETTSNFSYSSVERTVEEPVGRIDRISIAVVVDHVGEEGGADEPSARVERSPQEIAEIEGFVKSAVGFDEARGDVVTVSQRPFVRPTVLDPGSGFDLLRYLPIIKYPALVLLLLAVFLLFLRPTLRTMHQAITAGAQRGDASGSGLLESGSALPRSGDVEGMRHRLTKLAQEHPEGMARTLRVWLVDDQRSQQ